MPRCEERRTITVGTLDSAGLPRPLQPHHVHRFVCELCEYSVRLGLVGVALHIYQPYRVNANSDGLAQLACSFNHTGRGQELRVTLLRGLAGKDVVCKSSFQLPNTSLESDEPLSCQGNASANRLDLTVPGLSGADTDFYRCKVEILYPPPYRLGLGSGTLIYVAGKDGEPLMPTSYVARLVSRKQIHRELLVESRRPAVELVSTYAKPLFRSPFIAGAEFQNKAAE
ncbi:CTLA4 protein, partial [Polypterus senegalus]